MEKNRLSEARSTKGFTQGQIAEKLCMSLSSYQRREKGEIKIRITEWEKLAKVLETPLSEIFEPEETQSFIYHDHAIGNYQGTNNICIPTSLLETQDKYIKLLEEKIEGLTNSLQHK